MKANTEQDVRELARKALTKRQQELQKNRETLISEIQTNANKSGNYIYEAIAELFALDDDKFAILAPYFIDELENVYNDPDTKLELIRNYNALGIKYEDLVAQTQEIINAIDALGNELLNLDRRKFLKQVTAIIAASLADSKEIAHRIILVQCQLCHDSAKVPVYAHPTDAGADLYAVEDITINPGEIIKVPTGIKLAIPKGYAVLVHPRSGLSSKSHLRIANSIGLIDSDYRGEILVLIENNDPPIRKITPNADGTITGIGNLEFGQSYTIGKGERFAQLRLVEVPKMEFVEVDDVSKIGDDRGGGFGSTNSL